jgi:energy-coupling factor transporter ATP-binding protein EcfA2
MSSGPAARRPADNPFASHRVEGLPYRQNGFSPKDLVPRLIELRGRAAIVGPHGSGKTTLLEELAHILPADSVMVRLPGSCRHPWRTTRAQLPNPVTASHAVLIDGAEQLGRYGWRRLVSATRQAGFLVATLHRPGTLPTLIECRPDPHLLSELTSELAPADAAALEPILDQIFQHHEGDIRLCLRELYDVYAGRTNLEL